MEFTSLNMSHCLIFRETVVNVVVLHPSVCLALDLIFFL